MLRFYAFALSLPLSLVTASAQVWSNAPIGGGGATTGWVGSELSETMYLRTDVAGVYRRRSPDEPWTRITDFFQVEIGERLKGCLGLAIHPTNDDILYAVLPRGIYKSIDQGDTWTQSLAIRNLTNGSPNGDQRDRFYGEYIAVDPFDGDVVYFGSQREGLRYSRDGGDTWQRATVQLPGGQSVDGFSSVVVDDTRGRVGGVGSRASHVYVGTKGNGVFRSTDGGNSWNQWIAEFPRRDGASNTGSYPRQMRLSTGGALFVAHNQGLARFNGPSSGGTWTDLSPVVGKEVWSVDVNVKNGNRLLAFAEPELYRSRDQGDTWEAVSSVVGDMPGWANGLNNHFPTELVTRAITFDKQVNGNNARAYICSNYHPWETEDIWATPVVWDAADDGNEMTINIAGASLPPAAGLADGVPYLAGMADVRGFKFDDPTAQADERLVMNGSVDYRTPNITTIDFSESDPSKVWFVGSKMPEEQAQLWRSSDGGERLAWVTNPTTGTSWNDSLPNGKYENGGPKLAVSATNPEEAVILVRDLVRYSHDGGATWANSGGLGGADNSGWLKRTIEYEFDQLLRGDRAEGSTYYLYNDRGTFYRSTDRGVSFREVPTAGLPAKAYTSLNAGSLNSSTGGGVHMAAAPGIAGELWLSLAGAGIWRASGSGAGVARTDEFTEVTYFARANPSGVTFGAPRPGSTTPTLYVFGQRRQDGKWGIYRSGNLGETWVRQTPVDRPGLWPRLIVGDRTTFGRVFVGDASFGVRVLEYLDPALPVELVGLRARSTEANGACVTALSWDVGTERDVDRYVVEASGDGVAFAAAAEVPARGDAEYAASVEYAPYFRVRAVDLDGGSARSDVVAAGACEAGQGLGAFPNPAFAGEEVTLDGLREGERVRLISAAGREITSWTATGTRLAVPTGELPRGVYALSVGTRALRLAIR